MHFKNIKIQGFQHDRSVNKSFSVNKSTSSIIWIHILLAVIVLTEKLTIILTKRLLFCSTCSTQIH